MSERMPAPWWSLLDARRHLSFVALTLRDAAGVTSRCGTDDDHLRAAMDWLCHAHDATGGAGMSSGYSWLVGWQEPYPETTGYVIPTLLDYATLTGDDQYVARARRMGDWELEIQLPTGAIRGGIGLNAYPIVFNTGQVMLGWAALYRRTSDERYLNAARRAADWLSEIQDSDGKWSKHTFNNVPHAYHSRVAWPVLEVYALTREERYRETAARNVDWVLRLANENGWFREMGFNRGELPFTHTIAYTLRGLFECARLLEGELRQRIDNAVQKACEQILLRYERRKRDPRGMPEYLPGTLDENWRSTDRYSCLTGNAQLAIVFLKLFERIDDPRFLNAALKLIDQVKATQPMRATNGGIRGAVAGSYPIWGTYTRFGYPNWATMFLVDALMLSRSVLARQQQEAT